MAESETFQERVKTKRERPVYTYTIPEPAANGVTSIGLVELTSDEELQAAKRSRGDTHRLAYELAKQSVAEINGEKVSIADGSLDSAWAGMSPKIRNLVLMAHAKLHAPEEEVSAAFLSSQQVRVG